MTEVGTKEMLCAPRAQVEWGFGGRRKVRDGALLIALFLGGVGSGQFVVSTWLFEYDLSAAIGLLFVAVGKSAAHLIYLGRPSRFFRMFLRPHSSWISRGFIFMVVFIVFGAAYLAPAYGLTWLPWTAEDDAGRLLLAVALVAAFVVMVYDGFALASCKSISSWRTMLLPVIFFTYAFAGGVAMTALTALAGGGLGSDRDTLVSLDMLLLGAMLALVVFYIFDLAGSDVTARESLRTLVMSRMAVFFIGLAILAGLMVPLALTILHHAEGAGPLASVLLAASALLELVGDLSVRHSILRAGLHAPVY